MTDGPRNEVDFPAEWVRAQRSVFAYITASIPDFHAAEDVLQAVATKAFRMHDRFDPAASRFSTWAIGIARHEIAHWFRTSGRDRHVFDEDVLDALAEAAEVFDGRIGDLQQALIDCVSAVSDRGRQILRLRYEQNLRLREIAERLDSTPNSINVTLIRLRSSLLDCMREKTGIAEADS